MFAEVVISNVIPKLDKIYHYKIPDSLTGQAEVGAQVLIPFGRRQEIGYIVGKIKHTDFKGIKEIIRITSTHPLFSEKQVELARWIADYYCSFFISALRLMMPAGSKNYKC